MPNWIEGTMRVRGKKKDIINFLKNGFAQNKLTKGEDGNFVHQTVGNGLSHCDENDGYIDVSIIEDAYIKGTHRAFTSGGYVYLEGDDEEERIAVIPTKQAWAWIPENYEELSKIYNLDFKLVGWERGMEYEGHCEVLRGELATYEEIKYDDWLWESPCPNMGG